MHLELAIRALKPGECTGAYFATNCDTSLQLERVVFLYEQTAIVGLFYWDSSKSKNPS